MKTSWKRILSLLLIAAMVLSFGVTGYAADGDEDIVLEEPEAQAAADQQPASASGGTELEQKDLDPATLGVHKLGEETQEDKDGEISLIETGEALSPEEFDPDELVRVSIFLDEAATLDLGYPMRSLGTNSAAIAYRSSLRAAQDALTAAIESETGHALDVCWNMTLATNAISAFVRAGDIRQISEMKGVRAVVRENYYLPPVEEPAEPNTANTSENMVGAQAAWAAGYTGAGSRVAIIDTGIDTTHQSFADEPFTYSVGQAGATGELMTVNDISNVLSQLNAKQKLSSVTAAQLNGNRTKIVYGFNYVDGNTTIDHKSDTQGEHGSHVAGIAAANRYIGSAHQDAARTVGAVGMAPDAQLLIMKVFGSGGGAYDSDYMVAIEDAILLDCDAVNLSLGSGAQGWTFDDTYQDVLNNLIDKAHNEGMVVSISAGNAYDFAKLTNAGNLYKDDVYYHTGGSPGSFVNSLCVAAAQNTLTEGMPMIFNGSQTVFYSESTEDGDGNTYTNPLLTTVAGSYSYVYIDAVGEAADYSTVNGAESLSGKIVIVNRGGITFSEKGNNAINYKPKAVIIANNSDGTILMNLADYTGSFPMVSITLKDANLIKDSSVEHTANGITYYTGSVEITTTMQSEILDRSQATITDFSSWGVPGSLIMKPEITAPGGDIYSVAGTHKTSSGGTAGGSDQYEYMSGTSMAAPHITGLSAVVAEYLRENPVSESNSSLDDGYSTRAIIQSLLMSTATPMQPDGEYLSVLQQGAGLADVSKAVTSPSVLMMSEEGKTLTVRTYANADGKVKAEFGDDPEREGVYSFGFTLYNLTDEDLSYTLSTDLFTQKISGEFLTRGTAMLPGGGVSYTWNGVAPAPSSEHDVNKDGKTDEDDAQAILDWLAYLVEDEDIDLDVADMDGDELVTSYDAYLLLNDEPSGGTPTGDYVLAAHETAEVTVTITLTDAQRSFLETNYPKGAYLEGFTYVKCTDSTKEGESLAHVHSIPLLGFYGSWTGPSMFDNMSYIDGLYGAEREPYSGTADTNYLVLNYNGSNIKFSGNPYMAEDEFPADRLALSSDTNLVRISYNLIRSAGTTGYAVTRLDDEGKVDSILSSTVTGNGVTGQWRSQTNGWQNTGTKIYSINKTVGSYNLAEGDRFRLGFYAIPEYNGMIVNDSYNEAGSGLLSLGGFNTLLTDNVLGKGAMVGYDFVVDDTEPLIVSAVLDGNTITARIKDNENLAYVAVLSLDGTVKYAEAAPGTDSYDLSFDAADAIANANGYVAVFAGDYAGNESAKAIKVNNNGSADPYTPTSISITPTSLDLYKGSSADLSAKVMPITAEDRDVTWSSSNSSIATVDQNGHVTAVAAGTTTITATAKGNSAVTGSCSVNVVAVDKTLNAIVWDEAGGVYFSSFNANNLPTWNKLHNNAVGVYLHNAFMANASTLYASTLDPSDTSVIYSVNRSSYAVSEYGTNYVPAFGMARASTRYTGYFVYGFASYLIFGNLAPETDEELGTFSGFPYGLLELAKTDVGDAYVCAVCPRQIGTTSSSFYFLDETGKIWQTTMSIGSNVSFKTPTLVVDTGMSAGLQYQSLYYDGRTYIYWSRQADNVSELLIYNINANKLYRAGNFGEGVWPVAGLYVDGSAAPAAIDEEEPMSLDLQPVATRDELLTEEIRERMALALGGGTAEGDLQLVDEPDADLEIDEPETDDIVIEPDGTLTAFRGTTALLDANAVTPDEDGLVRVEITEESAGTNGLIAISYDPTVLTVDKEKTHSDLEYSAVCIDDNEDKGIITFAYANKTELPADTVLIELVFAAPCEDTEVNADRLEHNQDFEIEEPFADFEISGSHDWGEPAYAWTETETGYTVTATAVCRRDASHELTETVTASYEVITPPTTSSEGLGRYTATFTEEPFTTQTKDVVIEKLSGSGYIVHIEDYTESAAACSLTDGGEYEGDVVFTVEAETAVLVAVKDGEDYTVLKCSTDDNGVHSFTVRVDKETTIALAFKGDSDLSGKIEALDGTRIKRVALETYTLTEKLALLVSDIDGNGTIEALEGTQVSRAALGTWTLPW